MGEGCAAGVAPGGRPREGRLEKARGRPYYIKDIIGFKFDGIVLANRVLAVNDGN
jgi:hypothetical protein